MKKIVLLLSISIYSLFGNDTNEVIRYDNLMKMINEEFQTCIKTNNYMSCENERIKNKGQADIFKVNFDASERKIKQRKIKEELSKNPVEKTKEEKERDLLLSECMKSAKTIEYNKECFKLVIVEQKTKKEVDLKIQEFNKKEEPKLFR